MKTIKVKKLWMGHLVSIRDYSVNTGIKEGGLTVEHDNKTMFLSVEELKKGLEERQLTKNLNSKFKNKTYNLIDFRWNPSDENQEEFPF